MKSWLFLILFVSFGAQQKVHAQFDAGAFGDPNSLLSDEITSAIVKTVGFGVDQHAMQPATPINLNGGLDIYVEAMLFRTPDYFQEALTNAGFGSDLPTSLPFARIHIVKGFGESTDVGISAISYTKYLVVGGDIKWALHVPEEGATWAFRISYNYAKLDIVRTNTITPQILVSRKLSFADPYLGLGIQYAWGSLAVPLSMVTTPPDGVDISGQVATKSASAFSASLFIGVGVKLGPSGLKMILEGSYNLMAVHHLGFGLGLSL
jgi:hypothetical protein